MAMRTTKLFPTSNQTADCHNICDSTCPYGCYPYPDIDYYIPPQALVPPQTPPQSSNKQVQNISPYIIASAALLASLFLLISYYLIIVRNCSNWNRRTSPRTQPEGVNEESLNENQGPIADHPIWYINTIGLPPSIINLITVFKYKRGDGLIDGTECSVCLTEFQDDDSLRLLPKCNHAFHIHCIDIWLRSHTNCPLCRAAIIISNTATARMGTIVPISGTNMNTNEDNGSQTDIIVEVNNTNQGSETELQENVSRVTSTQDEFQETERIETSKKERIRRSFSVDSSIATRIGIQMFVLPKGEGEKSCVESTRVEEASSSKLEIGGNSSSRMQRVIESASSSLKRSLTYSGRSFFTKHHRNPNSVLPL